MNRKDIQNIADAVLYEGYMLYPYRPSAVKNRQRWNFGVLYPRLYSEQQSGTDAWFLQAECLLRGGENTSIDVTPRFLHAVSRLIGKAAGSGVDGQREDNCEIVDSLAVGNDVLRPWQEAVECDVPVSSIRLGDLLEEPLRDAFSFPSSRDVVEARDEAGSVAALVIRVREAVAGSVELRAALCSEGLFKLTVLVSNLTTVDPSPFLSREEALPKSLLSAHAVLGVTGGEFVSLMDPPAGLEAIVSGCKNVGVWPVLVGEENSKDAMLASPIILYDYPRIAPESAGNLFDGTEIDEILALRILTLSDEEKREIRETGERPRDVLERTENMPPEHFLKLHGVLRGMKPVDDAASGFKPDIEDHR